MLKSSKDISVYNGKLLVFKKVEVATDDVLITMIKLNDEILSWEVSNITDSGRFDFQLDQNNNDVFNAFLSFFHNLQKLKNTDDKRISIINKFDTNNKSGFIIGTNSKEDMISLMFHIDIEDIPDSIRIILFDYLIKNQIKTSSAFLNLFDTLYELSNQKRLIRHN